MMRRVSLHFLFSFFKPPPIPPGGRLELEVALAPLGVPRRAMSIIYVVKLSMRDKGSRRAYISIQELLRYVILSGTLYSRFSLVKMVIELVPLVIGCPGKGKAALPFFFLGKERQERGLIPPNPPALGGNSY